MDIEQRKYFEKRIIDICDNGITNLEHDLDAAYKECLKDIVDTFLFKYADQIKVTLQMFAEKSPEEIVSIMTTDKPVTSGVTRPESALFGEAKHAYNIGFSKLINEIDNVGMRSFKTELDPLFASLRRTYNDIYKAKKERMKKVSKQYTDTVYSPNFDELNTYDFMLTVEDEFKEIIKTAITSLKDETKALKSTL